MTGNTTSTPLDWVDPDDAPELTDHFFDNAEVKIGDRVVRAATDTMAGRDRSSKVEAPTEQEMLRPSLGAPSLAPAAPARKMAVGQEQVLARLKAAIGLRTPPVEEVADAGPSPLYSALVQELGAAESESTLRQWALATAQRRSMLSALERSMLRSEVAAKQAWLEEQGQAGEGRENS